MRFRRPPPAFGWRGRNGDARRTNHLTKTRPKPRPQEPPQAVTARRSRCLPQPATETAARASEPQCMRRRTCKAGAFSHGLWQRWRFCAAPILWAWELDRDWLERGPDSRIFSQASMRVRRSGTIVAFAGVENLSALPIGTPPCKHPEISHGDCHMVAKKNGLSEGSDKPLI